MICVGNIICHSLSRKEKVSFSFGDGLTGEVFLAEVIALLDPNVKT